MSELYTRVEKDTEHVVHEGAAESVDCDLCHPFYKENQGLVLVDRVLHGLLERNPLRA